jgi:hypothetical protein
MPLDVLHPVSRKPIGLVLMIYGSDSNVYRAASAARSERRMKIMKPGRVQLTAAELEEDAIAVLVQVTASWSWEKECTINGRQPPFAPAEVETLYKALPWIAEQVDSFLGDRSNFFTKPVETFNLTANGTSE